MQRRERGSRESFCSPQRPRGDDQMNQMMMKKDEEELYSLDEIEEGHEMFHSEIMTGRQCSQCTLCGVTRSFRRGDC